MDNQSISQSVQTGLTEGIESLYVLEDDLSETFVSIVDTIL